ncbi:heavy metal translocating P-type ATPase [Paenibacillus xylaniclasticus]|uniref:heavy metal translocating P-type ATPase n=1 Tax=Paenibacillus xylaniclasticus TaxID=588083 RepID=UPI000FDB6734|nr:MULTISPECIES: cation-translocating P-type ATPase [Paenibacillus]GFN31800.1 copper-exporting P-type ATPase A [Paenibacillus curdlanolyticus]
MTKQMLEAPADLHPDQGSDIEVESMQGGGLYEPTALHLRIGGMHCSACAVRIEKAVGRLPGVLQSAVSYASRSAWIVYWPDQVTETAIHATIRKLGFHCVSGTNSAFDERERRMLLTRVLLSVLFTVPLLLPMAHHYEALSFIPIPTWLMNGWVQLALATVIQFVPAAPFYYGAYYAIKQKSANMDVLVVTGTTAAYLYSHYMMFHGGANGLYFETSAVVITAVLIGKWIEATAAGRTAAELSGYTALQPRTAIIVRGETTAEIAADALTPGDRVVVAPGERFPADGTLWSDDAETDESLLTGESRSVLKKQGDKVYAGSMNLRNSVIVIVESSGSSTALFRLNAMMREALASKTSIQRKADALAGIFVPIMLMLAAITFVINYFWWTGYQSEASFLRALAVLLAACPCALGLATPLSLAAAAAATAKRGVVIKQADALELLARLKTVVFDKTGTLTEGRAEVSAVYSPVVHSAALLRLAAAAEANASHPFASAVRSAAAKSSGDRGSGYGTRPSRAHRLDLTSYASANLNGRNIVVGGYDLVKERGWSISEEIRGFAEERERKGDTIWYVFDEAHCAGAIALTDTIRPEAAAAVASLRRLGIRVLLASGDRAAAVNAVSAKVRIHEAHASLKPEQKLALIRSLQQARGAVAMVGDGWNDAPALAAADVGFAIGGGADAAMGAGQVALVHGRLTGVADTLMASRHAMRNVRQNLALAFIYNAAVIPSAVIGKLEPWMAGTAMALSSLSVVSNAIRLRWKLRMIGQ